MSEGLTAPPKLSAKRKTTVVAVVIAIVAVSSVVAYLQWVNSSLIFCYGGCGVRLGITSVTLKQVGIATFNMTNVWSHDIAVTQGMVYWNNGTQGPISVNSGNVVPAHRFLVLSVNFNMTWESGVSYLFILSTDQGFPNKAVGQL